MEYENKDERRIMTREEEILIEKVIWLIEDSYPDTDEWSHDRLVTNIKKDLKSRESELDRMFCTHLKSPWHKASEELPKNGGFYLCMDENKHIVQLAFCGTKWVNTSQFIDIDLCLVKYWMEIPELPKED